MSHAMACAGLDFGLIRTIHRADDGYISFASKASGRFQDLFSVQTGQLEQSAESMQPLLTLDAFYTLNGLRMPGKGQSRHLPDLPSAHRNKSSVLYLNAAFVDLDLHQRGLEVEPVIQTVLGLQAAGSLPTASILVRSGRGVWLLWLLEDRDTGLPPRVSEATLKLYERLQQTINQRFADLGADTNAKDVARLTRVPGSINSKSGLPVCYWMQQDPVPAYTLENLAEAFAVPLQPPQATVLVSLPNPSGTQARTGRGSWDLYPSRLRQLEKLWQIRGGFPEGCRQNAAFLYANFLHRSGSKLETLTPKVHLLADACCPPFPREECEWAIKSALKPKARRFCNQTISNMLGITPEEAEQLETWPPASRFGGRREGPATKLDKQKARRKLILQLIRDLGGVLPSIRKMRQLLEEHGHRVSVGTVHRDYVALDLLAQAREPPERVLQGAV